jgi:hypothetical protein
LAAQDAPDSGIGAPHTWEITVHVGSSSIRTSTQGSARLPATVTRALPGFGTIPTVSTWYIADGAALLNDALAFTGSPLRITALDPVLTRSSTERDGGLAFGVRIIRAFNSRFGAELGVDASLVSISLTDAARVGIEDSSVSFARAFQNLPTSTAESSASIQQGDGARLNATGALHINVLTGRRMTPYVTVGGGIGTSLGALPSATLVGRYQVPLTPGFVDVTDTVTIRYEEAIAPVLLLGGGVTFELTRRTGLSADIRLGLRPNTGRLVVDAVRTDAGDPLASFAGPPISGFTTFTGGGLEVQTAVTVGYVRRF